MEAFRVFPFTGTVPPAEAACTEAQGRVMCGSKMPTPGPWSCSEQGAELPCPASHDSSKAHSNSCAVNTLYSLYLQHIFCSYM